MKTEVLAERGVAKRAGSRFNRAFRGPTTPVVFDDPTYGAAHQPVLVATLSLPCPSRAAAEIDPAQFREVLCVEHNRVFEKIA